MGKMNNLSLDLEELRKCASKISELVENIESTFSSSQEKAKDKRKSVTLEEVRAVLAEKSRLGKTAEVKELLVKFGVNKLSELDESKYDELLKEAEGI